MKVLVVSPNPEHFALFFTHLRGSYEFTEAKNAKEAEGFIISGGFDVVILNGRMTFKPDLVSSKDLLEEEGKNLPKIIVVGYSDEDKECGVDIAGTIAAPLLAIDFVPMGGQVGRRLQEILLQS